MKDINHPHHQWETAPSGIGSRTRSGLDEDLIEFLAIMVELKSKPKAPPIKMSSLDRPIKDAEELICEVKQHIKRVDQFLDQMKAFKAERKAIRSQLPESN